ncbi:cupredoxin domain-containing protein [Ferruginibacter sp. HRS2-29]|uniref:cupredoxin domain-containing protein n=1 Tax=Ferruginibacter sp. HRS2-29 TaxID=2487334 RepID=UPI0020CEC32F|nr:cupredoxin domain-containing protein [Ferruginibacter sp. HRS2-29]
MKQRLFFVAAALYLAFTFFACAKHTNYDAQGGGLPSNYIAVNDSSFSPVTLTVVSGSSITFVNNTTTAKSIITTDSVTIKATTIAPNSSFVFKKDTTGTFYYHLTNKPAAGGMFTLTP